MKKKQVPYHVGQRICLWQMHIDFKNKLAIVVQEVIVTITEWKTGVPGYFSQEPVSGRSLKATSSMGLLYKKHWESWPESQTSCFTDQWSLRIDGMTPEGLPAEEGSLDSFWYPKEAASEYGDATRHGFSVVDIHGNPMVPKGDVVLCREHNSYDHVGIPCLECYLEDRKTVNQ